jgi:hypothetical protein
MVNRNIKFLFAVFAILLISISFAMAFSVSTPYHKNNPLEMYPGQEREILFNLQNCPSLASTCDQEDVNVKAILEQGANIAKITSGTTYDIKYGTSDTNLKLNVKIPENVAIGTEYLIRFSLESIPEGQSGVSLGLKYNVEFPVLIKDQSDVPAVQVVAEEPKTGSLILIIILLVVVVLIVMVILYRLLQKGKQI